MHYRITGQGPAILWIHGLPTSGSLWDPLLPAFEESYTCVVVDLPGFGRSPLLAGHSLDPEAFSKELEKLRQELDYPRWHVVGHDAGSTIAVDYAANFPEYVDQLVLCSPPVFPEHKIPLLIWLLRAPFLGDLLAPLVNYLIWNVFFPVNLRKVPYPSASIIADFQRPFRGPGGSGRLQFLARWGDPVIVLGRSAEQLPNIQARTLILHGRKDEAIPTSFALRAAEAIPGAQVKILDSSHFLPLLCPEELGQEIRSFLAQVSGNGKTP